MLEYTEKAEQLLRSLPVERGLDDFSHLTSYIIERKI